MNAAPQDGSEELKQRISETVDDLATTLLDLSHRIHATPELAFEEFDACSRLVRAATEAGLTVRTPAFELPTAFAADFGSSTGPRVALVSEYDALPDIGHGCGHNIIATIGLGAALALHRLGDRLPGSVRYLGTPGEERGCGKELLAGAGAFDRVDAAMMLHPANVNLKAVRTQCLAEFEVTFIGRAAHAALAPQAARSALDALVLAYQALAQLRQHLKGSERITGVLTEGGAAPNVVPEKATAKYFIRAATTGDLKVLKGRAEACLRGAADAAGCELHVTWTEPDYLDMRINEPVADAYERNATMLGRVFTPYDQYPVAGTDMSNISHRVPVLHGTIACAPPHVMLHTREFTAAAVSPEGDKAVIDGAKALAMTAIDFLTDADLRRRAAQVFAL
ncbi:amidohydrolase [Micromonospora sp. NPDC049559]|uniref:amidohydrolase n=1 Tax=Micromonospora sp. NPDC049559 TaxID=3155923 RepID=UPI00341AAC41